MILGYIVGDFSIMSGIVYTPPPPSKKETDRGQPRGLGLQYHSLRREAVGRGRGAQAAELGGGRGSGDSRVGRKLSAEWGPYFSCVVPEPFPACRLPFLILCVPSLCFVVIPQHMAKSVQVQTFGIILYQVGVELWAGSGWICKGGYECVSFGHGAFYSASGCPKNA